MKTFEKVIQRMQQRENKPQHVVFRYNHTMEESREYMLVRAKDEKTLAFENVFEVCENRIHAIFLFLSLLELVQQQYLHIMIGEGKNNFIIEWNEDRKEDEVSSFE
jgi:segregation and condensation protein A